MLDLKKVERAGFCRQSDRNEQLDQDSYYSI